MAFSDIFKIKQLKSEIERLTSEVAGLRSLEKYRPIADVEAHIAKLREAHELTMRERESSVEIQIKNAEWKAKKIIEEAKKNANEIAREAIIERDKASEYRRTAEAMKNIIEGYGDEYIIPAYSLLDELAEEFGYDDAGKKLKEARDRTRVIIKDGKAAECEYVEANRRETATRFVVDAFNGKVDSILSRTKADNYGKQKQAIEDAFTLVNANGKAFRNAEITRTYLDARLGELRWACTALELKRRQQEEQRELRERMREEERAQREYAKAQKEAEKEEERYQKALDKARAEMETASEEMQAEYQAKVLELEQKIREAEEKKARALSMAQQTKRGNVYIISNIGSFGENIYKVGMTRRENPEERIRELGDASVPFPFDIHALIETNDAPALETELHRALIGAQLNKVNPRKEFFRTTLAQIKQLIDEKKVEKAEWTMLAVATEYRETMKIEKQIQEDPEIRARWESSMELEIRPGNDVIAETA